MILRDIQSSTAGPFVPTSISETPMPTYIQNALRIPRAGHTRPGIIVGASLGSVIAVFFILFAFFWWRGKGCVQRGQNQTTLDMETGDRYTPAIAPMSSRGSRASCVSSAAERRSVHSVHSSGSLPGSRREEIDPGLVSEHVPARPASPASLASHSSKLSKGSKISSRLQSASLPRLTTHSSDSSLKYSTTTDRLRDRPFSTIYDAEDSAANMTASADRDKVSDEEHTPTQEIIVNDPELRSDSSTSSPVRTSHDARDFGQMSPRERMVALYTQRRSGESARKEQHYTVTHERA